MVAYAQFGGPEPADGGHLNIVRWVLPFCCHVLQTNALPVFIREQRLAMSSSILVKRSGTLCKTTFTVSSPASSKSATVSSIFY